MVSVQAEPKRIPSVVEEFSTQGNSERQTRAVIELLVQHGTLELGVDMKLRPVGAGR